MYLLDLHGGRGGGKFVFGGEKDEEGGWDGGGGRVML